MIKFWRKILIIFIPSIFFAIFKTAIKYSKKSYNSILCYLAIGLWWVRSKFSKYVAPTDGKAGFKLIKNKEAQHSEPIGDGGDCNMGLYYYKMNLPAVSITTIELRRNRDWGAYG